MLSTFIKGQAFMKRYIKRSKIKLNLIIWKHASDPEKFCTYGGIYYFVESLTMNLTLIHTRLIPFHIKSR